MNKKKIELTMSTPPAHSTLTATRTNRADYCYFFAGVILSFFLASILMSGWPQGFKPNLNHPFVYAGDGLSHLWLTQRAIEGWIFENPRSGFPFGSSFLDYPGSDSGNLLILKLFGRIFGSYFSAFNFYYLFGFSATFAATFIILRKIGIVATLSFAAAIIFSFLPFHFARLFMGHFFYTWYFVVPIYFYCGIKAFGYVPGHISRTDFVKFGVLLAASSCFGVYFAFFGLLLILICGLAGSLRSGNFRATAFSLLLCGAISTGVFLNVLPNAINTIEEGRNPEVAQRVPLETEVYSLKVTHLLMPHQMHRIKAFRELAQRYQSTFPLSNTVSSLGIIGSIGFALLIFSFFQLSSGNNVDYRLRALTLLTLTLLLISTVGGLNVFFSLFISPTIRGWDRIGIFIGFFSVTAFFVVLQKILEERRFISRVAITLLPLVLVVGIWDQTSDASYNEALSSQQRFLQDQRFIAAIEEKMPKASAVYQIPYIPFPEGAPLFKMHGYDQLVGFLNSKSLRWSGGGMQGRAGDLLFRSLASKPMVEQVRTARDLGFSGIYVDRHGYGDGGAAAIDELSKVLGHGPTLSRDDNGAAFFSL